MKEARAIVKPNPNQCPRCGNYDTIEDPESTDFLKNKRCVECGLEFTEHYALMHVSSTYKENQEDERG